MRGVIMTANATLFAEKHSFQDNTRFGDFLRKFLPEDKVNKISMHIHNGFMFICCLIIVFCFAGWLRKFFDYMMGW